MARYPSLVVTAGQRRSIFSALLLVLFLAGPPYLQADTKGKLTGRIVDTRSAAVVGANILLVGTSVGAAADVDGRFLILNIPAGVYDVRISAVGFQTKLVKGVRVSAGQTTTLDVSLDEATISTAEVTAVAERPLVDTRQTSSVAILGKDDIAVLPVQSLTDVVNLQAGVVDGHFRGGRTGEVQYQVDGVSVNNPYDNSSVLSLDKSVLQEVQVISGTFDAEYGQAMSGVVNAVLRSGSEERFEANGELFGGGYVINAGGTSTFPHAGLTFPPPVQNYTLALSGPAILPRTSFLINVRRYIDDGYLYGERRFLPTDTSDFSAKIFRPTGDGSVRSLAGYEEWSGQFKIANRAFPDAQVSYQAIASWSSATPYNFDYRFNPDGQRELTRISLVHGIDWTQTLSQTAFFTLSVRQNYFHYTDYAFSDLMDPRYYAAGAPRGDPNYELGATIQGYDLGRFEQKTNSLVFKGSLTDQLTPIHLVKLGFEAQFSTMGFGAPGTLASEILSGTQSRVYIVPDSLAQNLRTYYPRSVAAFLQDRIEFTNFLVRAGLRVEYYDSHASVPSDLQNPANALPPPVPQSTLRRTTKKLALAPRLGISYPITAGGALYFSYGHFYQMPGFGNLYANSDYYILRNLQSGGISYGIMGNPDIRPEFTVQYEFGFKQEFGQALGVDASAFYKDIRDLLGVEFVNTYADAEYARFTNVDFGSVYGVKLTLDYRFSPSVSLSLNYTFENAVGNSSDPRETATRAQAGEDPRPRVIPFDWDQRHTLNVAGAATVADDYAATVILRCGSGSPYTPSVGSGFGANLETNSSQKPTWATVDLRLEKTFLLGHLALVPFVRVTNLFDARYANGFVFASTGSVWYSLTPAADARGLQDPSRFAAPRRIELGVGLRY